MSECLIYQLKPGSSMVWWLISVEFTSILMLLH